MRLPIKINKATSRVMLTSVIRHGLTGFGGFLAAKGIAEPEVVGQLLDPVSSTLAGVVLVGVSGLFGALTSKKKTNQLQVLERLVPDSVAVLK